MKKVYAILKKEIVETVIFIELEENGDVMTIHDKPESYRQIGEQPFPVRETKFKVNYELTEEDIASREFDGTIKRSE